MPSPYHSWKLLGIALLLLFPQTLAADVWSGPAFSADPASLRNAAGAVPAEKHSETTELLNDLYFRFDEIGGLTETHHLIYRIENQEGVKGWAEISGQWEAWHQAKPEIKARVMTSDGAVHWLDPKTLNDVPVHEDAPDIYSDARRYGGPLPALAPGAIVEEEVTVRDTAPLFAAGTVHRWSLAWSVPVNRTRVVLVHPVSLPLHFEVHLLPEATVKKTTENGQETITLEQGSLPAYRERTDYAPPDVILYPEIEFSTGTSWQAIAAEYARLTEEKIRPADVQALSAKLDIKSGSRNEVIRRLTAAVHSNVRYTGVEFGESSLIPQFPAETLNRKYGDCKDKATFLAAMLRGAGIPAYLALLDTGPGRDINANLPGMGMFDHAIVYVPASGGDPDQWIDATARYSQVGTLPWMDYGRWALIVSGKSEALKQTPALTAAQNVHRELREFQLAEYGTANIVETDLESGPEEADYREYYSRDSKDVRDSSEGYVKEMYLGESLISLEHGDLADMDQPASIKFVTKGKRGNTDLTTALMAIRVEALFDNLPKYFSTKAEEPANGAEEQEKPKRRTADWWIRPFTAEWRYKVIAPPGFKLRALPSDKSEQVDSLRFTQKYSANNEGTIVEATLRVENTNTRMTAQQAETLRDAVLKARASDPIFITFDHVGHALISAGRIKEGLAAYRQIAAQHPKEALHKTQLAQALVTAGLGEAARTVAREATAIEPNSALGFSVLAMVLKRDALGRLEKHGMDYDGAVAAYRKTIALDPKDKESRANLALLLEFDPEGVRYGEHARLKEAVEELRELKKLDEEYSRSYDDNVLYDLWYAHDFQGVLDEAGKLPANDARKGLMLAAVAVLQGSDAALKKSLEITTEDQGRSSVLLTAGAVLSRVRKYPEAAAMLAEGARGQSNESQIAQSAAIFAKTRPYEELKSDPGDPRSVVQELYGKLLGGNLKMEEFKSLLYDNLQYSDELHEEKKFKQMMANLKSQLGNSGLPLVTVADLALSNIHYAVDGDDSFGYKITIESPGAPPQDAYVVRAAGGYKVADLSISGTADPEDLAMLALMALDKNNLAAARKWLDRAREKIHLSGNDDPLAGPSFPIFWTKGQDADAQKIRTAALTLLPAKEVKDAYLRELIEARDRAKPGVERNRLDLVLAAAYAEQDQWAELLPPAEELLKSMPDSRRAMNLATAAYANLRRFDAWEKLVQEKMQQHPDEPEYVRDASRLATYRGQFREARQILKKLIDTSQATADDMNSYAWDALYIPGPIDQDAIEVAQRANDLSKNEDFAILHTLACVDAAAGKPNQARELLLKGMDAAHLEEPNDAVWLGFAMIAEQYGVLDAAETMYKRVEKPKFDYPASSYALAQQHLAELHRIANPAEKTGRK